MKDLYAPNELTLVVDRVLDARQEVVWRCWTDPDLLKQWYCPKPWRVPEADLDVRPGGRFNTVMAGPDGERVDNAGCYLEVVPGERLVFTDGYTEGFIPAPSQFMTGFVVLEDAPGGRTRQRWGARHGSREAAEQHLEMGFEQGWNAAADQLEALAKSLSQ
jgi:uncharacterized protein YndB with AHSA1/START domain